ncbi:hypothetical protein PVL29_020715 [Vitis rotundifolia]|uniref:FAF domain-containing protein n=1 Tax=Vitis rotundifolia TaxID=103349 RepID=A0AA38YXW5_VITRO|nr:hypothetical protein PVL29_020715 [Vitis rotundifolia]
MVFSQLNAKSKSSVSPLFQLLYQLFKFSVLPLFSHISTVANMSSSVCQGLQSCLEPLIIEPRASKLKLAPPKPNFSESFRFSKGVNDVDLEGHKNGELGGWDFIQALTNTSNYKEAFDNEKAYVHPLMKRSTSTILDQKGLEMCTESLGSETGSYTSKSDDEVPLLALKSGKKFTAWEPSKEPEIGVTRKMNGSRSFPPPLSSISSLDCVQVRPHRVGGRLVIKAVSVGTCHTYFHAERGDGRLRLQFLKGCSQNFDHEDDEDDGEDEFFEEVEDFEGGEEEEEDDYYEDCDEADGDSLYWCEDIEGKSECVGVEIGMEKLQRPTRCMKGGGHGGKSLLNWKTLWVAT